MRIAEGSFIVYKSSRYNRVYKTLKYDPDDNTVLVEICLDTDIQNLGKSLWLRATECVFLKKFLSGDAYECKGKN